MAPNFDAMPIELRNVPRWVVWKGSKIPYCATATNSTASVNEPSTWASFGQAQTAYEEGGYRGVGFVLNGDGIVGVDLDKCFDAGRPAAAALELLDRVGCRYIEVSPSGTGLRGFGYGENITGKRGQLDGISVELYASKRYLTVTGRPIASGPLVPLPGFSEVASSIRTPDLQKRTEDDRSHPQSSSVLLCRFPLNTLPDQPGQRNGCLFELVRYLKGAHPDATPQVLRGIVSIWHEQVAHIVGTKDFSVTWADFVRGWSKVRQPFGDVMRGIVNDAKSEAPPVGIEVLGYGEHGNKLVKICAALQAHHGQEPFFISARQAGDLLGIHFTDASRMLAALVADGVITLVSKGAGKVASRYRYAWRVNVPSTGHDGIALQDK